MTATLASLEAKALTVARLIVAQPAPVCEALIVSLEGSTKPALQGDLDRLIGAQARKLLGEQHDRPEDQGPQRPR